MPAFSADIWWAFIIGTLVLMILGFGLVGSIFIYQRRLIAAQREKMEAIRKREQQYSDLFNNVSDLVFIHSMDGKLLQVNAVLTKFLGYEKEELLGKHLTDVIEPAYHDKLLEYLENIKNKHESTGLLYLTSKTGEKKIFEYRNSMILKDGEPMAVRGIARNVTEKIAAEKALKDSEERFRRLTSFSPVPIAVHYKGKWVYVNDAGLKLVTAKKPDQFIGKSILRFVKKENRDRFKKRLAESLQNINQATIFEEQIISFDGQEKEVEIVAIPINYDGKEAGQVVIHDVTDQKRLQRQLVRAHRLETAGRVAGQIAHDFNNLLAPLTAYPTLIREDLHTEHSVVDLVNEMEAAADKIAEINQQLLTLGRRGHYNQEAVNLNNLIEQILASLKLPKAIAVKKEFSEKAPIVSGGPAQLTRAISNIILNAKEAMNNAGALKISTECLLLDKPLRGYQTIAAGEYVKVEISDTGCGIEPAIMDRIFEPFYSTKSTDNMRGSGLGLSIVHGVVEDHRGYILVESVVGKGTSFLLYFPVTNAELSEAEEAMELPLGNGEKVLIVDDDPVQRRVATQLLEWLGYQVSTTRNGEEAVKVVKERPQDLLLLDMLMDGIDGTETYRQILTFSPDQKAIILSGYAMSDRVNEALRLGANAFVSKPIVPRILAQEIKKALVKI